MCVPSIQRKRRILRPGKGSDRVKSGHHRTPWLRKPKRFMLDRRKEVEAHLTPVRVFLLGQSRVSFWCNLL
jgi:hypothetical protein